MKHWLENVREALAQHEKIVLVTVALIRGSTPREAGAHMIVTPDGFSGTIGGGNLEFRAIDQARDLITDGDDAVLYQDYPLGPALGQCCGGVASLLFETIEANAAWLSFEKSEFVTVSSLEAKIPRQVIDIARDDVANLLPTSVRRAATDMVDTTLLMQEEGYFLEKIEDSRIPLYIYGAGHVAHALVPILAHLPFSITWIDNREEMFDGMQGFDAEIKIVENQETMAAKAPDGAFHLVMTHDHGIDLEITHAVMDENRFGYMGLIGSDTKRVRFERRLKARGIDEAIVDQMISPIGIPEITGKRPGEVALSVAAELTILYQGMVANITKAERNSSFGGTREK